MKNDYKVSKDIQLVKEIRQYSNSQLADIFNVSLMSVNRWLKDDTNVSLTHINSIYNGFYNKGLRLNRIKEQLFKEDYNNKNNIVLFHGSKYGIQGNIDLDKSSLNNDFGKGFYCGENFEQSAVFVSGKENSSVYILNFNKSNLKHYEYSVDEDWMLTIAYFRDKSKRYKDHPKLKKVIKKIENCDYVIAPIADNKMFDLIDEFINGEITNIQAQHCLSATDLGKQYVLLSNKAIKQIEILQHCFLCDKERDDYLRIRKNDQDISNDKVKAARRNYRGEGLYIDEILK